VSDLRSLERVSIRSFVESCGNLFRDARVLDYGCGREPYADLIASFGARYDSYDDPRLPGFAGAPGEWPSWDPDPLYDVVVCTQVVQYVPDIEEFLQFTSWLTSQSANGHLVLTYPTNWPEVEEADLHRFTKAGMERLLTEAGFEVVRHERRAEFVWQGETFALGYGAVCRA